MKDLDKNQLIALHQMLNSKESRRFKLKSFFNNVLTLIQDFNGVGIGLTYSHSDMDELNNIICLTILFWSVEFSWKYRRKSGPMYEHDCTACVFLGRYKHYDLYYCNKSNETVIARYGEEGHQYHSGISFKSDPITEAKKRAIQKGLIKFN